MTGSRHPRYFWHGLLAAVLLWVSIPSPPVHAAQQAGGSEAEIEVQEADPEYPISGSILPCSTEPCSGIRLVDLRVRGSSKGDLGSGAFRLRLRDSAFLTAEIDADDRAFRLTTAKWEVAYRDTTRTQNLSLAYQDNRRRLRANALRGAREDRDSWLVGFDGSVRLSRDVEIIGSAFVDTDAGADAPSARILNSGSLGFRWQHATGWELQVKAVAERVKTAAGFELRRRAVEGEVVRQSGRTQMLGQVLYTRVMGPSAAFGREELAGRVRAELVLASHLRLEARGAYRVEIGLKDNHSAYGLSVVSYARRYRYARGGAAAPRVLDLTRAALDHGYDGRRLYGLESTRAIRDRLSLSPHRDDLAPLIEALYRATIADRNVPVLGLGIDRDDDALLGLETRSIDVLVGIPWPVAWPWQHNERAVRFVELQVRYTEGRINPGLRKPAWDVQLRAHLNRETLVWLAWLDALPTSLELATGTEPSARVQIGLAYAFGI